MGCSYSLILEIKFGATFELSHVLHDKKWFGGKPDYGIDTKPYHLNIFKTVRLNANEIKIDFYFDKIYSSK